MTMHAAKGLEFDTVYIIEANEGQIPYKKALKNRDGRRTQAVLCGHDQGKRAAENHICKKKNGKDVSPSRFVEELLEDAKN
mgnify:CR=1 FL=1